ncbi:hypothetical protein DL762_006248 [Monosporascus cannonballus]|uniref:Metallo-beta-lactamase domain-containing protein n=1 Tax=Monosporascus cannonballus TaxID=155416 RepID=A0ABY0H2L8_9PEZI|nr:hypothetical protein DL762_006248 [Monosporascus cannonballus]
MTGLPGAYFFESAMGGFGGSSGCSYSFLIGQGPSGDGLLFDLDNRKDMGNHAAAVLQMLEAAKGMPLTLKMEKNLHRGLNHMGYPSAFPASTDLVVGPGFEGHRRRGLPAKGGLSLQVVGVGGPEPHRAEFATGSRATRAGGWDAVVWFGDRSLYALHSPGHTNEHLCGLARTKLAAHSSLPGKDEFVLMAGDVCHHAASTGRAGSAPVPPARRSLAVSVPGSATRGATRGMRERIGGGRSFPLRETAFRITTSWRCERQCTTGL